MTLLRLYYVVAACRTRGYPTCAVEDVTSDSVVTIRCVYTVCNRLEGLAHAGRRALASTHLFWIKPIVCSLQLVAVIGSWLFDRETKDMEVGAFTDGFMKYVRCEMSM